MLRTSLLYGTRPVITLMDNGLLLKKKKRIEKKNHFGIKTRPRETAAHTRTLKLERRGLGARMESFSKHTN